MIVDCGTILNPQWVDAQVRGSVLQGLGAALFEHCRYDERGQMLDVNMADYLVPMAAEMPDIAVEHVVSPTTTANRVPSAPARLEPRARRRQLPLP